MCETSGISNITEATENTKAALLDEQKRRIWCFGPNSNSKINNQRFYLPVRFLAVMRPKDLIVLPGNHAPTRDLVNFMVPLLGLSDEQIIWTSGEHYSLNADITESIRDRIGATIRSSPSAVDENNVPTGCQWVLIPYSATKCFYKWTSDLLLEFPNNAPASSVRRATLEVFGESEEWNEKYGHKGILHRHMSSLSTRAVIEEIDENFKKTYVAKGYQCSNTEHLLGAYELLFAETSSRKAVIKPILGTSGFGIEFIDSAAQLSAYAFPMGEVLLEEMLNLDHTEDGLVISPAVHYVGDQIFGGKLVDQLMRETVYFGWRESKANPKFQEVVLDMTEKLIKFTNPKGPGGYDFLSVNGKPLLSDINTGRFNGAHQPKLFLLQNGCAHKRWYCWKHVPKVHVSLATVWNAFTAAGLAFNPLPLPLPLPLTICGGPSTTSNTDISSIQSEGKSKEKEGVFPLSYLGGIDAMFIAIADSSERAIELYGLARQVIEGLEK